MSGIGPITGITDFGAFDARLDLIEAQILTLQGAPPPLPPPGIIATLPLSASESTFLSTVADMTVDAIELGGGTNSTWDDVAIDVDRTSRPLVIRPVAGQSCRFTSNASSGNGIFKFGHSSTAKHITMDGGIQNGFVFSGQHLAAQGVIEIWNSDYLTLWNFQFDSLTRDSGYAAHPYNSWLAYIEGDGQSDHLLLDRWKCLRPTVNRDLSGIQCSTGSGPNGAITLTNMDFTGLAYAMYSEVPTNPLTLNAWSLTDCGWATANASIRFYTGINNTGSYQNIVATASNPLLNQSTGTMTNGGGNSGI